MTKEEILEKSRNVRDEREQSVGLRSFGLAGCVVAILVVIFSVWTAYRGGVVYGYAAILFAYLSASQLYRYSNLKTKFILVLGCIQAIIALINTILFFIKG
jgi:membrane associated rhomboid family serine protease